jgi:imipenem/basic amino acid-specific outer membrane pore
MKLGKLSLVAVMALGTSAFAIENVKVNGEAKLWYQTSEFSGQGAGTTASQDFFENDTNSLAQVKLSVGATADLLKNLSAGIKVTALSTLGLENNLVGGVPAATHEMDGDAATNSLDDQAWTEELYLAYTAGKTTAKVGRQALNTPLAFTETWNVVDNTFEAAVLLNNDLPDTTLVAAWVGNHNGTGMITEKANAPVIGQGRKTVSNNGKFGTFALDGAYAVGAVNKSLPNTTVQAWMYNVDNVADAYWLQADAKVMDMISLGLQYAGMTPDATSRDLQAATSQRDTDMLSVKAGC